MLFNRLFRERALERRARQEPLDDRLQITAPHEWLIVAGLAAMLVVLVIYGVFGSVDRTASYETVLVLPGELLALVSPVSGTVMDVLVEETDSVAQGQSIAYVQSSASRQFDEVIVELIDNLALSEQLTEPVREELLLSLASVRSTTYPFSEIVSPSGGKVVNLDLMPGRPVLVGDAVGLVSTESAGPPKVVALVSSDEASRLQAGMGALVSI